ncbi:MAG: aspartate--tRNA ligase [Eubacteriales bacterium]|nr:aspartate--tRNA ligase [Eubacteriales bacterium]
MQIGQETMKRSVYCGEVGESHVGQSLCLMGWVKRRRNLGGMVFLDLRDRSGICQLVVNEKSPEAVHEAVRDVRSEYVLAVRGEVLRRSSPNPDLPTGDYELQVETLIVLSASETPPFVLEEADQVSDVLRLRYRFLDLRRERLSNIIQLRSAMLNRTVDFFATHGFLQIETPYLGKSTPEGARDYLVPSRVYPGSFFALPQSPQLYKQMLMMSGFDRYFQIARCFRDEDLRADRQPEFTQVDLEMSFVDEDDVMDIAESYTHFLFENFGTGMEAPKFPLQRLTYREAMENYGSDKPDLRFGMKLHKICGWALSVDFPVFKNCVEAGGCVYAICAKGMGQASRKQIDKMTDLVRLYHAKGLAWFAPGESERGSILKFLSDANKQELCELMGAESGDLILIVADSERTAQTALGQLRLKIADEQGLLDPNRCAACWVTDFPLFEYSEEEQRYVAQHHPFTMIADEDVDYLESDPGRCRSKAYDLVVNGQEMAGGSIRIHDRDFQYRVLKHLGFSEERAKANFDFLLRAFDYGVPPHGGCAFGLDRWVMFFARTNNIRDVIAFPKVQSSSCLMTGAPSRVSEHQLMELGLEVEAKPEGDAASEGAEE